MRLPQNFFDDLSHFKINTSFGLFDMYDVITLYYKSPFKFRKKFKWKRNQHIENPEHEIVKYIPVDDYLELRQQLVDWRNKEETNTKINCYIKLRDQLSEVLFNDLDKNEACKKIDEFMLENNRIEKINKYLKYDTVVRGLCQK